jgi:hypothetical protein
MTMTIIYIDWCNKIVSIILKDDIFLRRLKKQQQKHKIRTKIKNLLYYYVKYNREFYFSINHR